MPVEVGAAADHKTSSTRTRRPSANNLIDQVAADKSGPPCNQIKVYFARQDRIFLLSHRRSALLIAEEGQNPSR